jgi:hypothetical protein
VFGLREKGKRELDTREKGEKYVFSHVWSINELEKRGQNWWVPPPFCFSSKQARKWQENPPFCNFPYLPFILSIFFGIGFETCCVNYLYTQCCTVILHFDNN